MAVNVSFNSFSLQDNNYITSTVKYRSSPSRDIVTEKIARKPGVKLLATEFGPREISIDGYIIGSDSSNLVTLIDNLNSNVTRDTLGTLIVESGKEIQALVSNLDIPDPHYTQSMVPFAIKFLAPDPFFYGNQQTVSLTVTSGSTQPRTQSVSLTISGTVFAEPTISYTAPGSSGYTTTSGIIIEYESTGETTTWSGGDIGLAYGQFVTFDYGNSILLEGSTELEAAGVFPRWEPGATAFTVTYSGGVQGGTLAFVYRPRYL